MNKFLKYLEWVIAHEGGYVNHHADPGGATNYGVTQAVYNDYLKASGKRPQSVAQITRKEVEAIYRVKYWLAIRGDELPVGWDYAMLDFGINSGVKRSIRFAQKAVGVEVDGVVGPATLAAIKAAPRAALDDFFAARLAFLKGLPHWLNFGKGWERRVNDVKKKVDIMLTEDKK